MVINMKIGIVTHFYNTVNYGGMLQAYALVRTINDISCDYKAEQIQYNSITANCGQSNKHSSILKIIYRKLKHIVFNFKREHILKARRKLFKSFAEEFVPMSANVYSKDSFQKIVDSYDVFITGSDQVWNPQWYDEVYRLDCVPNNKTKISYAAGLSSGDLTQEQKGTLTISLNSYLAVSVREKESVAKLNEFVKKDVIWTLDPTLIIPIGEWELLSSHRLIAEKYLFCYFLGQTTINSIIRKYAKDRGLKVVCITYLTSESKKKDSLGDLKLKDASPQDFVSLIKYAEYVFTDSFHATVFSHIYKKNFFVFNRAGLKSMNDRIYSLTSLFDTQDRFCDRKEKETLEYIESLTPIDYSKPFPKFEEMKEKSINFLKDNLKKAEEKINGYQ